MKSNSYTIDFLYFWWVQCKSQKMRCFLGPCSIEYCLCLPSRSWEPQNATVIFGETKQGWDLQVSYGLSPPDYFSDIYSQLRNDFIFNLYSWTCFLKNSKLQFLQLQSEKNNGYLKMRMKYILHGKYLFQRLIQMAAIFAVLQ